MIPCFLLWEYVDAIPVKRMQERDVPIARWVIIFSSNPRYKNVAINAGTIITPPPIPNIPANIPAITPTERNASSSIPIYENLLIYAGENSFNTDL